MSRPDYIYGSDGYTGPDDIIPRCAEGGSPKTFNGPDKIEKLWPRAFKVRVDDARVRISSGESLESVRERHGGIVVKAAVAAMNPKMRFVG